MVKNPPAVREMRFNPWVRKSPWRREWQPSVVAWEIPCTEEPGGPESVGSQSQNLATEQQLQAAAMPAPSTHECPTSLCPSRQHPPRAQTACCRSSRRPIPWTSQCVDPVLHLGHTVKSPGAFNSSWCWFTAPRGPDLSRLGHGRASGY